MATQVSILTAPEIRRRKAVLESKLKELLGVSRERDELRIEYLADPIDQVKSNADREMARQRIDQQTRLIHEFQSALAKIKEGTYGFCEQCEEPIPRQRLDAVPWAHLCVTCQSKEEAVKDHGKRIFQAA